MGEPMMGEGAASLRARRSGNSSPLYLYTQAGPRLHCRLITRQYNLGTAALCSTTWALLHCEVARDPPDVTASWATTHLARGENVAITIIHACTADRRGSRRAQRTRG